MAPEPRHHRIHAGKATHWLARLLFPDSKPTIAPTPRCNYASKSSSLWRSRFGPQIIRANVPNCLVQASRYFWVRS
ncbi:TPA: hypothetical protein IYE61_002805 [Enterococcus faecium]|nr:hypothetical protein [Enterococcus faecium]